MRRPRWRWWKWRWRSPRRRVVGGLEILPVRGIGDVRPGDDVTALIAAAAPWLRDNDVVVVTSKIVSKAEGRLADVPADGPEREVARQRLVAGETVRTVARRGHTQIVQTHHGYVMASAGIDASNVDRSQLVLLPKDPDSSARSIRSGLRARLGVNVAVIVSDTMGRPWRLGLVDVALGAAGIVALRDYRGEFDSYGNELHITQMAVVDELASAAELVKNKYDQVPVAVVRGFPCAPGPSDQDGPGAAVLVRDAEQDLFSLGTAEARVEGLRAAATLRDAPAFASVPADPAVVMRAIAAIQPTTTVFVPVSLGRVECRPHGDATPADLIALGEDIHRLRTALAAEGLSARWEPASAFQAGAPGVAGVLAIGHPPDG